MLHPIKIAMDKANTMPAGADMMEEKNCLKRNAALSMAKDDTQIVFDVENNT